MRVNITYSIEMDEIPEKVSDFLLDAAVSASELINTLNTLVSGMSGDFSIDNHLEEIDKVRRKLAGMDHTMLDCTDILHGYQKALVQLRESQMPAQELIKENTDDQNGNETTQ